MSSTSSTSASSELTARRQAYQIARNDYERRQALAKTGAVSAEELDHARQAYDAAQSAYTVAQEHYSASNVLVQGDGQPVLLTVHLIHSPSYPIGPWDESFAHVSGRESVVVVRINEAVPLVHKVGNTGSYSNDVGLVGSRTKDDAASGR